MSPSSEAATGLSEEGHAGRRTRDCHAGDDTRMGPFAAVPLTPELAAVGSERELRWPVLLYRDPALPAVNTPYDI